MSRLLAVLIAAALVVALVVVTHHRDAAVRTVTPHAVVVTGPVEAVPHDVLPSVRRGSRPRHPHLHRPPIRAVSLDVTAYCETGNRTASGVWPRYGMAASNLFSFGTRLRVPGWPVVVTVTDRIGAFSQLDLFSPSCSGAVKWGRRQLLVEVLP